MIKVFGAYVLCAALSYYPISGITFADFQRQFGGYQDGLWNDEEAYRNCKEDLGFALGWSVPASMFWPLFLPGLYLSSGFAHDGVWTKYTINECEKYAPSGAQG